MKAKLTTKHTTNNNIRYQIRGGEKGTGKVLWECNSWDNPRATEQAEIMATNFANQQGLTLTNEIEEGL
jgi:hypothetical protein